jgi:hypothetical protein
LMRNSPSEIALTDADRQYQAPPPPLVYENNGVAAAPASKSLSYKDL